MQIFILVFYFFNYLFWTQYTEDSSVVIFSVWTLKASDTFDKYLKRTFNPPATFFSSHQSIQRGETLTMDEHSPAKLCRGYGAANGKSPKYSVHHKILIHEQAAVSCCVLARDMHKTLRRLSSGICLISGDGNLDSRFLNLVLPVLTTTPCPSQHTAWPSPRLKGIASVISVTKSQLFCRRRTNPRLNTSDTAMLADPTRSLAHNLYSLRVQLWFIENVGRWEGSRFIMQRYSRKARSSDTHRL